MPGRRIAPAAAPRAAPRSRSQPASARSAVGTDAGGSTRIPAACNGVVGLKQSAGVIPHDMSPEVFANVSSINPMARTVMDTALMLEAMAGQHAERSLFLRRPVDRLRRRRQARRLPQGHAHRLAAAAGQHGDRRQVLEACEAAAMSLGALGASVEPMDDDMEPVEPIWFAYSSAMWNARFRDSPARNGATG